MPQRPPPLAASGAPQPGLPQPGRIRGGDARGALVRSARVYVCSHTTKRVSVALKYVEEEPSRSLRASALPWRTLDMVQGHALRWLVEVVVQDWQGHDGGAQLTKQPGAEGARRSGIRRWLVEHALCVHPDQAAQFTNNLPAYTVGSLRAHVPVECLVDVMEALLASADPQSRLPHFTTALPEVCAFGRSKQPMLPRPWGRREPTPSWKDRADEVMRHIPVLST